MKDKGNGSGLKGFIIGLVLIGLVLGYFYYLSVRKGGDESDEVEISPVQEVLLRNLDKSYPPSPREVLKYYGQLVQCFYGEEYTEEEFEQLAAKVMELYDDELAGNQTPEQYLENLRWDVDQWKEKETKVSSYSLPSSTDVDFFTEDGYSWARLYFGMNLRKGTQLDVINAVYLLRKDDQGHWKIYGWKLEEDLNGSGTAD